jgi:uncharacterized membrane protein YkvA (DUF1232 family)
MLALGECVQGVAGIACNGGIVVANRRNPSLMHKLRVEVHAAWLAARDPRTPWYARLVGLLVTAYAFSPLDLVPDFIPVLGLLDDVILIPLGLWLFREMLPAGVFDECRAAAEVASERPSSKFGAIIVIILWLLAVLLVVELLRFHYS